MGYSVTSSMHKQTTWYTKQYFTELASCCWFAVLKLKVFPVSTYFCVWWIEALTADQMLQECWVNNDISDLNLTFVAVLLLSANNSTSTSSKTLPPEGSSSRESMTMTISPEQLPGITRSQSCSRSARVLKTYFPSHYIINPLANKADINWLTGRFCQSYLMGSSSD